jgi:hypothetical protein
VYTTSTVAPLTWESYQETGEGFFLFACIMFVLLAIASLGLSAGAIYTAFFKKAP